MGNQESGSKNELRLTVKEMFLAGILIIAGYAMMLLAIIPDTFLERDPAETIFSFMFSIGLASGIMDGGSFSKRLAFPDSPPWFHPILGGIGLPIGAYLNGSLGLFQTLFTLPACMAAGVVAAYATISIIRIIRGVL